jgi:hypothetical protein
MTPRGELLFDLFHEYGEFPDTITYKIKDGRLGDETSRTPKQASFVRERKVGIIVPLDSAESIARWILNKVEEIKNMTEEPGKEVKD